MLSDKVEESIYHTYAVYKWTFFDRPIVLVLIVLTALSIWAALRYKPAGPPLDEDGPHSHRGRGPQLIFFAAMVVFAFGVIYDGIQWSFLTAIYPIIAGSLALIFMIPLGVQLWRSDAPSVAFYDSERDVFGKDVERRSAEHYLLWLLAMLGVSALAGFVIGIAVFIYAFMRIKASCAHWAYALGTAVFVMLMGLLSDRLSLEYPQGLLQSYVTLPWPLQ